MPQEKTNTIPPIRVMYNEEKFPGILKISKEYRDETYREFNQERRKKGLPELTEEEIKERICYQVPKGVADKEVCFNCKKKKQKREKQNEHLFILKSRAKTCRSMNISEDVIIEESVI